MSKYIGVLLTSFLLLQFASAEITLTLDVKDSFAVGEKEMFEYNILSDSDLQITILPHITCDSAPIKPLQEKNIDLKAGELFSDIYEDQIINDWIEPQTCTAYVQILKPVEKTVSKNFTIVTDPSFDFNLLFCKDPSCSEKAKVFTLDETLYIPFDSEVESPEISTTLTLPDNSTKQITLPATITPTQIGTYTLKVTASKEGYKTKTVTEMFGVIESNADIKFVSGDCIDNDGECNSDCIGRDTDCEGITDARDFLDGLGESPPAEPSTEPTGQQATTQKTGGNSPFILLLLIVVCIGAAYYLYYRRK